MTLDLCQSVRLYADHRPKDVPGSNAGLTLAAIDHLCATLGVTGRMRHAELGRRLDGVTQRMLTRQLRELEEVGLVSRKIFAEVPPRVEYSLTAHGRSLEPVIRALWDWGNAYLAERSQQASAPVVPMVKRQEPKRRAVVAVRAMR